MMIQSYFHQQQNYEYGLHSVWRLAIAYFAYIAKDGNAKKKQHAVNLSPLSNFHPFNSSQNTFSPQVQWKWNSTDGFAGWERLPLWQRQLDGDDEE